MYIRVCLTLVYVNSLSAMDSTYTTVLKRCSTSQLILTTIPIKGWQLDACCHWSYCAVTLNSNFAILKNLKLKFNLFILWRKGDGCLLCLKAFSWETDLWATWWFALKSEKIRKGNVYLTKIPFSRNEICCAEDDRSYMSNMYAKEFSNSNLN